MAFTITGSTTITDVRDGEDGSRFASTVDAFIIRPSSGSGTPTITGGEVTWDADGFELTTDPTVSGGMFSASRPAVSELNAGEVLFIVRYSNTEPGTGTTSTPVWGTVVRDVLEINDVASINYDGTRTGNNFQDYLDDPGSEGYFADAQSGTLVMSNAIIRGDSDVDTATIGGTAIVTTSLTSPENTTLDSQLPGSSTSGQGVQSTTSSILSNWDIPDTATNYFVSTFDMLFMGFL